MRRPPQFFLFLSFVIACATATAALAATSQTYLVPGHSGIWYDPARSGEGYVLEILSPTSASLTWFTFDDSGAPRWLVGLGELEEDESGNQSLAFSELYVTSGGVFGEDFDPSAVERTLSGSARIAFTGCASGSIEFQAFGHAVTIPLTRIAQTMGLECAPVHGVPGRPVEAHYNQSGSWYDPSHSGEGFQLQWSNHNQALLTWYTYDKQGNQFWLTGVGTLDGSAIHFPSLTSAHGARFGDAFDPDDVQREHWGALTLQLDCLNGTARYEPDIAAFGAGEQDLRKLTGLFGHDCGEFKRSLFDLYDVEVKPVPTNSSPASWWDVRVESIADDGTIAAKVPWNHEWALARLAPGDEQWELATELPLSVTPFQISADGERILVREDPPELSDPRGVYLWNKATGMSGLDLELDQNTANAGSRDLAHVVGNGRFLGEVSLTPWLWSEASGQVLLPKTGEIRSPYPWAVSADGRTVFGFDVRPVKGEAPRERGIVWTDANEPRFLKDPSGVILGIAFPCNLDCSVVFGAGQGEPVKEHPYDKQPWYRLASGEVGYLGMLPDAFLHGPYSPFQPSESTADGSLVVGNYNTAGDFGGPIGTDGFLWTQYTGLVSLRALLAELQSEDIDWDESRLADVSTDGAYLLLSGLKKPGGASPRTYHSAILELRPATLGVSSQP